MNHLSDKQKVTIMIAIMVAMFFSAINQTIIGVAMPRIIASLGGMDYYTWVITIYLLTMAVATILVGKLSDIYGRKPFLLAGIGFFMVGAFLSGFSSTIFQLIILRGLTGIGGGMIMSTAFTAVGDLYLPRERARWTGLMSGIFGISSVLGPLMGGFIVDHLDWHWVFWIFLPLGIVAFGMIFKLFPSVPKREGESIDYVGSAFLTITIVSLLLAFSLAGEGAGKYAWSSWQILGLFGLTAVSLAIFIFVESKVQTPVLPLSLFKNDIVTVSNLCGFLLGMGMMGVMIYTPFFIQGVKGISPSGSGYIMMPMSIVMVFATTFAGGYMTKTGKYKGLAISGLGITSMGIFLLSMIDAATPVYVLISYLCIIGIGLGASMPVFSLTVQNAVPLGQLGVASASSQLFRSLGNTMGIGILGAVMSSRMASRMKDAYAQGGEGASVMSQLPPEQAKELGALVNPEMLLDQPKLEKALASMPADLKPVAEGLIASVRDVFSDALTTTFLAGGIIMVIAVLLAVFLRAIPLVSAKPDAGTVDKGKTPAKPVMQNEK
ncbi:drug resistance transporter, EmrB/QacA subfamily [Bhargavaea beijingensis]|uniref:Drug resistance transporter, EmrB/QacA subfamily n=1 Tax=Bhargavaea beijingensis TaxID=426756 RepID=A0A1G7EWP8_9BACL|nr:MDR family MFS transporter [Bhargavaea beijingensis]SDE68064.1 drug resistance transporter, EmrB/QacA subfamily [Bhargavaea beijingensis]